jgi:hypothetical protein
MDVQILGDDKVDMSRHAVLAYDGKTHKATLLPGESRGLAYINNEAVYAPKPLDNYTEIEIGDSKLVFVAFCGEDFVW